MLIDYRATPLTVGDRVLPVYVGGGVPLWLSNTRGTIVRMNRTRVVVQFDSTTGTRTVDPSYLRRLDSAVCTCGADQFRGCFCGLTLSEFLASPGRRTV